MSEKLRVAVTQAHIDAGLRTYLHCPLALALRADGHANVFVTPTWATSDKMRAEISKADSAWIKRFDAKRKVKPRVFELTVKSRVTE